MDGWCPVAFLPSLLSSFLPLSFRLYYARYLFAVVLYRLFSESLNMGWLLSLHTFPSLLLSFFPPSQLSSLLYTLRGINGVMMLCLSPFVMSSSVFSYSVVWGVKKCIAVGGVVASVPPFFSLTSLLCVDGDIKGMVVLYLYLSLMGSCTFSYLLRLTD